MLNERESGCDKVMDPSRYFAVYLLACLAVVLRHQTKPLVGIVHASGDLNKFLRVHFQNIVREGAVVGPVDVCHSS